jgi:hypothetical protein
MSTTAVRIGVWSPDRLFLPVTSSVIRLRYGDTLLRYGGGRFREERTE